MRPWTLVAIFALLALLDALTTVYLFNTFPDGRELNPYVNPGSLSGLLFAPVKLVIYFIFLVCLVFSENRAKAVATRSYALTDDVLVAYIPLFLIFIKLFAVINNLMPLLGISTPISYVLIAMKGLPGDESFHYSLFWTLLFLLMIPVGLMIIGRMYRQESTDNDAESG